jgi:hypothetical protein
VAHVAGTVLRTFGSIRRQWYAFATD